MDFHSLSNNMHTCASPLGRNKLKIGPYADCTDQNQTAHSKLPVLPGIFTVYLFS